MKSFIAAGILLASAPAAIANPFEDLIREEPQDIRACGDAFGPREDVCYGQHVKGELFPFSRGVGIDVDHYKTVRVSCSLPHVTGTTRGNIAKEYCPDVRAGFLAPAPFLD